MCPFYTAACSTKSTEIILFRLYIAAKTEKILFLQEPGQKQDLGALLRDWLPASINQQFLLHCRSILNPDYFVLAKPQPEIYWRPLLQKITNFLITDRQGRTYNRLRQSSLSGGRTACFIIISVDYWSLVFLLLSFIFFTLDFFFRFFFFLLAAFLASSQSTAALPQ